MSQSLSAANADATRPQPMTFGVWIAAAAAALLGIGVPLVVTMVATKAAPPIASVAGATGFDADAAARGKRAFMSCIACHGKNGTGVPNLGSDLTLSSFVANQSDANLIAFIRKGRLPTDPGTKLRLTMPPKGGNPAMTEAQLADVVVYIRSLQANATGTAAR